MSTLSLAFSPCPNDTFVFHALAHGLVEGAPPVEATRPLPADAPVSPAPAPPAGDATRPATTRVIPREDDEPQSPGFHLYRPSGQPPADEDDE